MPHHVHRKNKLHTNNNSFNTYKNILLQPADNTLQKEIVDNIKRSSRHIIKVKKNNRTKINIILIKKNHNNFGNNDRVITQNTRTRKMTTTTPIISSIQKNRLCKVSHGLNCFNVDSIWNIESIIKK